MRLAALWLLLLAPPALAAGPPRCAEDADGGACVWGRVEGFEGGAVQIRGLHIQLAGVVVPTRHDLCASKTSKEEFDCARPARKRMAELVAKGIACEIVDVSSGQLWGRCKGPDGDLGRLLVAAGVAKAAKDGPYDDSQKQAVLGKKGLWAADMVLPRDWEAARRKTEDRAED
jgi:endonuclease YncB( thermonuclease family)